VPLYRRGLSPGGTDMSDDKSKTVADRKRINVHEDHELRYWSKKFGVSHDHVLSENHIRTY
jgi:hypothetical protein